MSLVHPSGPRLRRLYADLAAMNELKQASDLIVFSCEGNPPDRYVVTYSCRGLYWQEGAHRPSLSYKHTAEFYLHRDYPRRPPQIIWRTPIFHPNILPPEAGGAVCIGSWSPAESLADLVVRVGEMVQYRQYNPDDVLYPEAAAWAEEHTNELPVDNRPLATYVI